MLSTSRTIFGCVCVLLATGVAGEYVPGILQLSPEVAFSHTLVNSFLDTLRGWKPVATYISEIMDNIKKGSSSPGTYANQFYSHGAFVGYVVCSILGILFIIFMPLVGFFFCCCRCCCKNCGGKTRPMEGKQDKMARGCCGVIFLILITVMLIGAVIAFLNTLSLNKSLVSTNEDENVVMRASKTINKTETAAIGFLQDLNQSLSSNFALFRTNVSTNVNELVETVTNESGINTVMPPLRILDSDIRGLKNNFKNDKDRFETSNTYIDANLPRIKNEITADLTACGTPCDTLKTQTNNLVKNYDDSKIYTPVAQEIVNKLPNDIGISETENAINGISDEVQSNINKTLDNVQDMLDNALNITALESQVKNTINSVKKYLVDSSGNSYEKQVRDLGGRYELLALVILCSLLLLILALFYFGLLFGVCGERPYEDASLCNRGVGANMYMAGVAFSFLFSAIFMLVTMIFFIVGGVVQTEACRYVTTVKGVQSLDSMLTDLEPLIMKNMGNMNISQYISMVDNPMEGLFIKCAKEPLSSFVKPDLKVFISEDQLNFNINFDEVIKKIKEKVDKAVTELENLDAQTNGTNTTILTDSITELNKTVTKIGDLQQYITDLKGLNRPALASPIKELEDNVLGAQGIHNVMIGHFQAISRTVSPKEALRIQLAAIPDNMNTSIHNELPNIISGIKKLVLVTMPHKVLSDIECKTLQGALRYGIDTVCISVVAQINGFWCGFGIFVIFMIPSIIFATHLAGYYRRWEKYSKDRIEPEYMMNDTIPLADMNQQKYRNGNGLSNLSYDHDAPPHKNGNNKNSRY